MSAMPSVDAKIGVRRKEHRIGEGFGHAHQASVREAHGYVGVLPHELENFRDVLVKAEGRYDGLAIQ